MRIQHRIQLASVLSVSLMVCGYYLQKNLHVVEQPTLRKQVLVNDIAWYGGKPTAPVSFELKKTNSLLFKGQTVFVETKLIAGKKCDSLRVRLRGVDSLELKSWNSMGQEWLSVNCVGGQEIPLIAEVQLAEDQRGLLVADIEMNSGEESFAVSKSISMQTALGAHQANKAIAFRKDSVGNLYHEMASTHE